jgi:DNA-directed RNA polymerase specialized sigma24 family protein
MTRETATGMGIGGRFPTTRGSAIRAARSEDEGERRRAAAALVAVYWKPVYKHLRLRWHKSSEDAKEWTQAFFVRALEKDFFASYDPLRARFRTFVRTCLDAFAANEHKAGQRWKRGGGVEVLSLDFDDAEHELRRIEPVSPDTIERQFDREWSRSLFAIAVEALRVECEAHGRQTQFAAFERYDLSSDGPKVTYEALAEQLCVPVTTVTNHLAWARREFRRLVLEALREMTASDEEFRGEARALLGVELP